MAPALPAGQHCRLAERAVRKGAARAACAAASGCLGNRLQRVYAILGTTPILEHG